MRLWRNSGHRSLQGGREAAATHRGRQHCIAASPYLRNHHRCCRRRLGGSSSCSVADEPLLEGARSPAGSAALTGSRGIGQPLVHGSAVGGEQIGWSLRRGGLVQPPHLTGLELQPLADWQTVCSPRGTRSNRAHCRRSLCSTFRYRNTGMPLDKNTRSDGGVVPGWGGESARDARGDQRRQEGEREERKERRMRKMGSFFSSQ